QVDTNGIKIEYKVDGKEGAPYVTFITGIANDFTLWDDQAAAFGKDYRILRYDLRGHGDTQATEGDYSIELLLRDLLGLLNELNIEDKLPQIKAPTLYVSGAEDKLGGPPELMSELAKKVPGAQHRSIPKAAHIANVQNPSSFNTLVVDFLKRQK